jgi:hypothetical protein
MPGKFASLVLRVCPCAGRRKFADRRISPPALSFRGFYQNARRGGSGFEIKGLIAVLKNEAVPFAPYIELWGKWRLQVSALKITERTIVRKVRWLRTYDASRDAIAEIPLGADEKPVNGQPLPPQGVNVKITKIEAAADARLWWTLGFEAFGDLDSARGSLQKTVQFLLGQSFEVPRSGEFLNYPRWLSRIKT